MVGYYLILIGILPMIFLRVDLLAILQGTVIKTKSVKYIAFFQSLVSFLNGSYWTA